MRVPLNSRFYQQCSLIFVELKKDEGFLGVFNFYVGAGINQPKVFVLVDKSVSFYGSGGTKSGFLCTDDIDDSKLLITCK